MKTVLVMGDSIRLGYQERVKELLSDVAQVFAPEENCRFTKYALWGMHVWAEETGVERFDLAHWNTGIWDLHRATADGEVFTPLEAYVEDNERLLTQMQSCADRLIWATTIPAGPSLDKGMESDALINSKGRPARIRLCVPQVRWNADVKRYNEAACHMYRSRGVAINDLYTALLPDLEAYISEDGIHPNEKGYALLAEQTARAIRQQLNAG